jgi:hypothetical protein
LSQDVRGFLAIGAVSEARTSRQHNIAAIRQAMALAANSAA